MKKVPKVLNINLGIIGHVDSGKTSLAKVLSDQGSTASFDKHPQSQERGITLDLGFSVVHLPMPERFKNLAEFESFQFTIVDCPGHSAFIRTVIGGAQIIDFMLLVIDATKGVQTQTAEGLVIAELTTDVLVVAMNKIDQFELGEKDPEYLKMKKKVETILSKTKFRAPPMVAVAANPKTGGAQNLSVLVEELVKSAPIPKRDIVAKNKFLFSVDHCFLVKGSGTIMTGTVLRGSVSVGDSIEIADLKTEKKVKSMQMFRCPIDVGKQGDRLGICVTQFDAEKLERGIVCYPKSVKTVQMCLVSFSRIRYFQGEIKSGQRYHISIGHRTATAKIFFLLATAENGVYQYADAPSASESLRCLMKFDAAVLCPDDSIYIGSKLDADESTPGCRIAFHGSVSEVLDVGSEFKNSPLKVYKLKQRKGRIDRVVSDTEVICVGMFKNYDMNSLVGFEIECGGCLGKVVGSFGAAKNGKFRADFPKGEFLAKGDDLPPVTMTFRKFLSANHKKDRKFVQ